MTRTHQLITSLSSSISRIAEVAVEEVMQVGETMTTTREAMAAAVMTIEVAVFNEVDAVALNTNRLSSTKVTTTMAITVTIIVVITEVEVGTSEAITTSMAISSRIKAVAAEET